MARNQGAFLEAAGKPLVIRDLEIPTPGPNDIIVKNCAVAINPIDVVQQQKGFFIKSFPIIVGHDVAGEVYAIGADVTKFKPGDRVFGHSWSMGSGDPADGAFQAYTKVPARNAAILPAAHSFVEGAVLPLALDTAIALFQANSAVGLSSLTSNSQSSNGVLLVYGGSSSVGAVATQLAVASGFRVIAIASPRNHNLCRESGASQVFDYRDPYLVQHVINAVGQDQFKGIFDVIAEESTFKHDLEILEKLGGAPLACTHKPPTNLPPNSEAKAVFGLGEFSFPIWENFIPRAIANGQLKPLPKPFVIGKGLASIQEGIDKLSSGVSAQKIVVEL